ncbi:unnamed protein product, partial [Mesorhabditis spiculigera]
MKKQRPQIRAATPNEYISSPTHFRKVSTMTHRDAQRMLAELELMNKPPPPPIQPKSWQAEMGDGKAIPTKLHPVPTNIPPILEPDELSDHSWTDDEDESIYTYIDDASLSNRTSPRPLSYQSGVSGKFSAFSADTDGSISPPRMPATPVPRPPKPEVQPKTHKMGAKRLQVVPNPPPMLIQVPRIIEHHEEEHYFETEISTLTTEERDFPVVQIPRHSIIALPNKLPEPKKSFFNWDAVKPDFSKIKFFQKEDPKPVKVEEKSPLPVTPNHGLKIDEEEVKKISARLGGLQAKAMPKKDHHHLTGDDISLPTNFHTPTPGNYETPRNSNSSVETPGYQPRFAKNPASAKAKQPAVKASPPPNQDHRRQPHCSLETPILFSEKDLEDEERKMPRNIKMGLDGVLYSNVTEAAFGPYQNLSPFGKEGAKSFGAPPPRPPKKDKKWTMQGDDMVVLRDGPDSFDAEPVGIREPSAIITPQPAKIRPPTVAADLERPGFLGLGMMMGLDDAIPIDSPPPNAYLPVNPKVKNEPLMPPAPLNRNTPHDAPAESAPIYMKMPLPTQSNAQQKPTAPVRVSTKSVAAPVPPAPVQAAKIPPPRPPPPSLKPVLELIVTNELPETSHKDPPQPSPKSYRNPSKRSPGVNSVDYLASDEQSDNETTESTPGNDNNVLYSIPLKKTTPPISPIREQQKKLSVRKSDKVHQSELEKIATELSEGRYFNPEPKKDSPTTLIGGHANQGNSAAAMEGCPTYACPLPRGFELDQIFEAIDDLDDHLQKEDSECQSETHGVLPAGKAEEPTPATLETPIPTATHQQTMPPLSFMQISRRQLPRAQCQPQGNPEKRQK